MRLQLYLSDLREAKRKISASTVQRCVAGAAAPILMAAGAAGWEALKQIGARKYEGAKRIFCESIQPGGLISDVVFPKKEFEILGRATMEMALAYCEVICCDWYNTLFLEGVIKKMLKIF